MCSTAWRKALRQKSVPRKAVFEVPMHRTPEKRTKNVVQPIELPASHIVRVSVKAATPRYCQFTPYHAEILASPYEGVKTIIGVANVFGEFGTSKLATLRLEKTGCLFGKNLAR